MIRMQIQFTEEQVRVLRRRAAADERAIADLVREAVDRSLTERVGPSRAELRRRAREVIGTFDFGVPDLAERHDRYLGDAFDS